MTQLNGKPAVSLLAEDDPDDQELTRCALEEGKIRPDRLLLRFEPAKDRWPSGVATPPCQ